MAKAMCKRYALYANLNAITTSLFISNSVSGQFGADNSARTFRRGQFGVGLFGVGQFGATICSGQFGANKILIFIENSVFIHQYSIVYPASISAICFSSISFLFSNISYQSCFYFSSIFSPITLPFREYSFY